LHVELPIQIASDSPVNIIRIKKDNSPHTYFKSGEMERFGFKKKSKLPLKIKNNSLANNAMVNNNLNNSLQEQIRRIKQNSIFV
jgi:hypothetical protein